MKLWFAFVLVLALAGCYRSPSGPPPIAENIRCKGNDDCEEASNKFNALIRRRFPIGSTQARLEQALLAQGFERVFTFKQCVRPSEESTMQTGQTYVQCPTWDQNWNPRHLLSYRYSEEMFSFCGRSLEVKWSSDSKANITHIEGSYVAPCL